jgi:hypothetical protein
MKYRGRHPGCQERKRPKNGLITPAFIKMSLSDSTESERRSLADAKKEKEVDESI